MNTIERVLPAHEVDMGGIPVLQPFPTAATEQIDPLLLLHHSVIRTREGSHPLQAGIGPHPHRGFMPVTYVIRGALHHRDSLGNSSVITEGGAQWLNAGRGIIHSERPSKELARGGGEVEVVQVWINLPQSNKLSPPAYHGIEPSDIPRKALGEGVELGLIAGNYQDLKAPVETPFPVFFAELKSKSVKGNARFDIPTGMAGGLYVIKGRGRISGFGLFEAKNFYEFDGTIEEMSFETEGDFLALAMMGKPINEPLATYGPFVMNSQTEILEAMRDYNMGKMGILIEE